MRRLLITLLSLAALALPKAASAQAPDEVDEAARTYYERGLRLYAKGEYAQASVQLSLAYDLDVHPNIIYAWAQAERLDNNCAKASRLYREYQEYDLSEEQASAAQANLLRCQEMLEDQERDAERDADADPSEPGDDKRDGTTGLSEELASTKAPGPWYEDPLSLGLLVTAGIAGGISVWAYTDALDIEDRAIGEPDDLKYEALRSKSADRRTTAAITAGVGGLSLVLALVRIGMRDTAGAGAGDARVQIYRGEGATGVVWAGGF